MKQERYFRSELGLHKGQALRYIFNDLRVLVEEIDVWYSNLSIPADRMIQEFLKDTIENPAIRKYVVKYFELAMKHGEGSKLHSEEMLTWSTEFFEQLKLADKFAKHFKITIEV